MDLKLETTTTELPFMMEDCEFFQLGNERTAVFQDNNNDLDYDEKEDLGSICTDDLNLPSTDEDMEIEEESSKIPQSQVGGENKDNVLLGNEESRTSGADDSKEATGRNTDTKAGTTLNSAIVIDDEDTVDSECVIVKVAAQSPICIDDDDDDEDTDLKQRLIKFAAKKGFRKFIALRAADRFGNFESACQWMVSTRNNLVNNQKRCPSIVETTFEQQQPHQGWTCNRCNLGNKPYFEYCKGCKSPSPSRMQIIAYEEELSKAKREATKAKEELEASKLELLSKTAWNAADTQSLDVPKYWDPFPQGTKRFEVELVNAVSGTPQAEERDRMLSVFIAGGIYKVKRLISLKRIQNLPIWQRYAAQRELVASKASNKGNPNVKYLFHGPRTNTDAILRDGFVGQYGMSFPYGTWTHTSSEYSGNSFADWKPPGGIGRRIFICQAAIGTPGYDNGSGRRPNEVLPGVLADCHKNGGIHVFYIDSQLYPEYLIHWE